MSTLDKFQLVKATVMPTKKKKAKLLDVSIIQDRFSIDEQGHWVPEELPKVLDAVSCVIMLSDGTTIVTANKNSHALISTLKWPLRTPSSGEAVAALQSWHDKLFAAQEEVRQPQGLVEFMQSQPKACDALRWNMMELHQALTALVWAAASKRTDWAEAALEKTLGSWFWDCKPPQRTQIAAKLVEEGVEAVILQQALLAAAYWVCKNPTGAPVPAAQAQPPQEAAPAAQAAPESSADMPALARGLVDIALSVFTGDTGPLTQEAKVHLQEGAAALEGLKWSIADTNLVCYWSVKGQADSSDPCQQAMRRLQKELGLQVEATGEPHRTVSVEVPLCVPASEAAGGPAHSAAGTSASWTLMREMRLLVLHVSQDAAQFTELFSDKGSEIAPVSSIPLRHPFGFADATGPPKNSRILLCRALVGNRAALALDADNVRGQPETSQPHDQWLDGARAAADAAIQAVLRMKPQQPLSTLQRYSMPTRGAASGRRQPSRERGATRTFSGPSQARSSRGRDRRMPRSGGRGSW